MAEVGCPRFTQGGLSFHSSENLCLRWQLSLQQELGCYGGQELGHDLIWEMGKLMGNDRSPRWGPAAYITSLLIREGAGHADPEKASRRLRKLLMFGNGIWAVRVSCHCC